MRLSKAAAGAAAVPLVLAAAAACGSSGGSPSSSSAVPGTLTVWRAGAEVPAQDAWMNDVVAQFHRNYPKFATTKIKVDWVPFTTITQQWQTALSTGKNAPDVTEIGNTQTQGLAGQGMLADITSDVRAWPSKADLIPADVANDIQNGKTYAVPWFGGFRGVWYHKSQFAAQHLTPPASWAQLAADAQKLQSAYPGTYGLGAPSEETNLIASFIWGAGGEIAVRHGGKWAGQLDTAPSQAGIKFYAGLTTTYKVSPQQYIGETELGPKGSTSGGANKDFALGKLDMYMDGPWATAQFDAIAAKDKADWAMFPLPGRSGGLAPVFSGGSDLGVWAATKYPGAAWDLVQTMDSPANATSFATAQNFYPPFSSQLTSRAVTGNPYLAALARAASVAKIAPLNSVNWPVADDTDLIIPTMVKSLEQGASFASTVSGANTHLQNVLNTGQG